jgi:streptogramin lyase
MAKTESNNFFILFDFSLQSYKTFRRNQRYHPINLYFYRLKMFCMKYLKIFTLLIASWLASANLFAQDGVSIGNWRTHLPYHKVIAVEPVGNKIYAATEYELFYYDKEDNSINILNRINGLSDIGISTMCYNTSQRKLLVAYTNANVDLIDSDGNIKNMREIKDKNIVGNKSINNVFCNGDLAYVACGFGIVVFDLKKEEVKDTYYIGNQGDAVNVTDIAFFNDRIYASTDDGVYYAAQDAQNLANYSAWHFDSSLIHPHLAYTEMEVFNGKLYLNYDGGYDADTLFVHNGSVWGYFDKADVSQKYELRAYNDRFILTNRYKISVRDANLNEMLSIYSPGGSIEPLSAALDNSGNYWIGDTRRGLIKTDDGWNNMDVKPNGPASKNVFELQACGDQVWIATGGHAANWGKRYMKEGVARFKGSWTIFNSSTLSDFETYSDFVCTATDPNDPSVTYVGTWGKGLLKFQDDELVEVYNADNSTLDYWVKDPSLINISGLAFDSKGNLWVANTGANKLLSVMERSTGNWRSFNLGGSLSGIDIGTLLIDNNDYKWIIRRGGEVIVFNDNGTLDNTSDDRVANLNTAAGSGKLSGAVNCLIVDSNGQVWAGTDKGPCYFSNTSLIFSGSNFDAIQKEVPRNDGTNQYDYLFAGSNVLSMAAMEGSDQIWFGLESGVYLMSFEGKPFEGKPKEIHYFNTDNSPLLDNAVNTMAIDKSGEVFFGTSSGVISYRGEYATPELIISDVVAYPNPVRMNYSGYVGIKGLVSNSLVRITTVDGTFVTQLISEGGQAVWDCTNINGEKVEPGVYLIFVSTKRGTNKFATKILVQN